MFAIKTLKNGIRFITAPSNGTEAASIFIMIRVGSRYETPEVEGGSHFLEHLMFKGTKRHPTARDLSKILDAYGADYNAYTGKDHTAYYVKIASEHLPVGADLLHDMVFHSKFEAAEVKREKNVIVEEINMYEDNPRMHVGDLLEEAMFTGSTLGRNIAGDRPSIRGMKRSGLLKYYQRFYIPHRIVVVLSGKVDTRLANKTQELFSAVPVGERCDYSFAPALADPTKSLTIRRQEKPTEQIQLALGFPGKRYGSEEMPALKVLSVILGEGMSSRLFVAVRERRGLAYSVSASITPYEDTGVFDVSAGLDKSRLPLAAKVIKQQLELMKQGGPTVDELRRAKDHIAGKTLLRLEDCASRADWYGNQALFTPQAIKTPEERLAEIRAVTRAEVVKVAREVLDFNRLSIGVIGPFKSDDAVARYFL